MRCLAIAVVLATFAVAVFARRTPRAHELTPDYTYSQFRKDTGLHITDMAELATREAVFNKNLRDILAHNSNPAALYKKGVNRFTDRTEAELKAMRGNKIKAMYNQVQELHKKNVQYELKQGYSLPQAVDWRNHSHAVLTAVKDQGDCGSCWAHATIEEVESFWAIKTKDLFVLSQQQLTSCAPNPQQCGGTGGCSGATFEVAIDYLSQTVNIAQEWVYSYSSYTGVSGTCQSMLPVYSPVVVGGYVNVKSNDQHSLMEAVASEGPIAISVAASLWPSYESGIFDGCGTSGAGTDIDHAVQLVGYGSENGVNYWIVRNSWSASWGEAGFIRLKRESTAQCGWDTTPADGTQCKGGPSEFWVCGQCGILFDTGYPLVDAPSKN